MLITLLLSCALSSPASSVAVESIIAEQSKAVCVLHFPAAATLPVITKVPAKENIRANCRKVNGLCRLDAVVVSVFQNVEPPFARIRSPTCFFIPRDIKLRKTAERVPLSIKTPIKIRAPAFNLYQTV